MPVVHLAAIM